MDFVMILVVLLPMFAGLFQLSLVLHVQNTLASAAAEGARRAAVTGATPDDGIARAREQILGTLNAKYARDITVEDMVIGGVPAYRVVITAEVPALGLGGPAIALEASGNAIIEEPQ
ncbi:TadE/TadG family type IV pilus assembly protein [Nocardioides sp.]|uniref:TadE/TadG family type IV pilus assembly protein n=1 Tax=Nocardioides sp. TaxID=35761 RepID=UPI002606C9B5|nr:TadE/TadG family type IV pilus assembly protein [Nocardioides sp.]